MEGSVLVTGATGYIGSQLVDALLAAGVRVRAMTREPERLAGLASRGVEVVRGDVLDRRSLTEALRDVRAAYYLVHSMAGSDSRRTFEEYDRFAAQNFAAAAAHVPQIIYLGGLGRADDTLSPHLRSRQEVAEILLSGPAPATVLRAGIVIGRGSASFTMLLYLVRRLPVMITPRWVENRTQPIAIADTISYLHAALGNQKALRHNFDIGGPEVLTYREMMQRTAAILGKRLTIIGVPVLTPTLSSYWVDLFTPVPFELVQPLIEGLRNDTIVQDDSAQRVMPIPLTPFENAVRDALQIERQAQEGTTFTDGRT
ncbi:MAG TPA: NAD(P)H-binding protein [Chloroflexota bacterium]